MIHVNDLELVLGHLFFRTDEKKTFKDMLETRCPLSAEARDILKVLSTPEVTEATLSAALKLTFLMGQSSAVPYC